MLFDEIRNVDPRYSAFVQQAMISERPRNKPSSNHIERPISYNKVRTTSWGTMVERFWKRCTRRLALPATWTERLAGTLAARTLKKRDQSLFLLSMVGKWRMRQDNIREGIASTRRIAGTFGSGYLERPAY